MAQTTLPTRPQHKSDPRQQINTVWSMLQYFINSIYDLHSHDILTLSNFPNDGTKYLAGDMTWKTTPTPPKITTSAFSGGPPASPGDSDIWVATGVSTTGERWMFQYNAASASAYKWEFVGGSEIEIHNTSTDNLSGSVWSALTGMAYTVSRAGDYIIKGAAHGVNSAGGATTMQLGISQNSTSAILQLLGQSSINNASYAYVMGGTAYRVNATAVGDILRLLGWGNAAGASPSTVTYRSFEIVPVRIA